MTRTAVTRSLVSSPIIGVVRTHDDESALSDARALLAGGLELVEITFTVPGATDLVRRLLEERGGDGPPWIGMGTVTGPERAERAVAAGAEYIVSPNVSREVAEVAKQAGLFLVLGALTPTEISAADDLGADIVKVYPLPPVGGPTYLATVRQPLGDVKMLAAGGFGVDAIPAYRDAGASAFGIGAGILLGPPPAPDEGGDAVRRALALARGGSTP